MGRKWTYQAATFVILLAAWLVLSGLFDLFHLALGILSSALVTWFSSDLWFSNRTAAPSARWRELSRLPGYLAWLLYEIFLANVHVLRLALHPAGMRDVEPRVIKFKTTLKTNFARWVLANSITLTPGTVTIQIKDDEFFVHAISRQAAMSLDGKMEARVKHIFEPGEETK